MSLYSSPPPLRTFGENKPTLLVCWWITLFCTTVILLRIAGRFIRSEKLFREDRTAGFAIIPLFLRMACVHVILIWGTNNAELPPNLSDTEIRRKSIASGLVLASRILQATTLWILKCAILDFFKRLTSTSWKRSYDLTLLFIRCTLGMTFIGVIISDFVECRPFHNYYQVLPDPGGECRQGYVQLLTMASCNVVTDLLLVFFPVPIILRSHMTTKRKFQLVLLFSLSLGVVGVTLYRVPHIIWQNGNQQIRSLLASVELLFATAAANALVLGSFVRDRGVKKARYRHGSITGESIDASAWSQRRPTIHRNWGSDEDLVRDLGLGADRQLRSKNGGGLDDGPRFTPAPLAKLSQDMNNWRFPRGQGSPGGQSEVSLLPLQATRSDNTNTTNTPTPRRVSFFDAGGLLGDEQSYRTRDQDRDSFQSNVDPLSPHTLLSPYNYNTSHDLPTPTIPAGATGFRRGSQALLQDLGGLWSPFSPKSPRPKGSPTGTELATISPPPRPPSWDTAEYRGGPILSDPGGLLR